MREGGTRKEDRPLAGGEGTGLGPGAGQAITGPTPDRAAAAPTSVLLAHSHTLPA